MSETTTPTNHTTPSGCYRQPTEGRGEGENGTRTETIVYKGLYSTLKTYTESLHGGDTIESNYIVTTWQLQRGNGGTGVLTVNCLPKDSRTESEDPNAPSGTSTQNPIKDVWSIHNVRNDKNILAYCGPSPGANALRSQVEMWMKETDGDLAEAFQYRAPDGTVTELSENSQKIAALIASGVESVIRFYPVVTRKRTYSEPPEDCLDSVGFVDTPPVNGSSLSPNEKKPSGLANKIADYDWLKMQDDVDEQADNTFVRTESWWGIKTSDSPSGQNPWNRNLYGPNRWGFPADFAGGGGAQ